MAQTTAPAALTLVSHALCPYVQRVAIVLHEKGLAFERRTIDLARKPDSVSYTHLTLPTTPYV